VLTGDSFFHLSGYGESLPGLNLCGAGRVVCLIDPVGDVYACPFTIHDAFLAGNVRHTGGFAGVWRSSELFAELRRPSGGGACTACSAYDACRGGCMAAKFFTGLPLDGPDPECVRGHGQTALSTVAPGGAPRPSQDHSHRDAKAGSARLTPRGRPSQGAGPVPVTIGRRPPERACDDSPLAGSPRPVAELPGR
jgi:radical SAM protein with 4Fe4S-binding SPASM domain